MFWHGSLTLSHSLELRVLGVTFASFLFLVIQGVKKQDCNLNADDSRDRSQMLYKWGRLRHFKI